jgi:peptide deformylase
MQIVVPDEFKYLYVTDAEHPIVKVPDPVLRDVAAEVSKISKKTALLIDDMMRIMKRANGVGLAAPQLGILQRVIVVAPLDYKPMALINPVITKLEGEVVGQEGCLSIPGLYGDVKRAEYIEVDCLDRKGREITIELEGMPARIVQHEVDHLDGRLFIDLVDVATLHWSHPGETADAE